MRTLSFLLFLLSLAYPSFALANDNQSDAAVMKMKVFKFAVSTSKACTDPITIFSSVAGVEQDLLTSPTFGSGQVAAGTYPCVLIEVSKIIHTKGTTLCTTEFPDVICNDNQLSQLIDGTSVTCTGGYDNDQHVTLYINTLNTGNRGDRALLPPSSETDTASGLKLTSPFVVSSNVSGTLRVSPTNFIQQSNSQCGTQAPTFSFD